MLLGEDAVDRQGLAGLDQQQVAGGDGFDRDVGDLGAVATVRQTGGAGEQGGELAPGAGGGVFLQRAAAGDHQGDDGGGEEFAQRQGGEDGEQGDQVDAELAAQQAADHVGGDHGGDQGGGEAPEQGGGGRPQGAGGEAEQHQPGQQAARLGQGWEAPWRHAVVSAAAGRAAVGRRFSRFRAGR